LLEIDQFDPEHFRLEPAPEAPTLPRPTKRRVGRIPRLNENYVRVPASWFTGGPRQSPFDQRGRLFLLLLHLSRFGARPVVLTSSVVKQLGITRQRRLQIIEQLEADGWVQITRDGRRALAVCPIVNAEGAETGLTSGTCQA